MFVSECSLESLSSGSAQALDSARAGVSPPPPPPAEREGSTEPELDQHSTW